MALNSDALNLDQWPDGYLGPQGLYNLEADNISPWIQEHCNNFLQPESSQDTHLLPPNLLGSQPSRKRCSSSITIPDGDDGHHRAKLQKREDGSPQNLETSSLSAETPSPYARNTPRAFAPPTAIPKSKMFACPFFKKKGPKYPSMKDWKCCLGSGPGWTIHRLKEHLYRKHASQYQCPRCLVEFDDNTDPHEHQRCTIPCLIQPPDQLKMGRIDAQQVIRLKKKSPRLSDEEKWNEMYRIVFRLDSTAKLPSPDYEDPTPVPKIEAIPHLEGALLRQLLSHLQDLQQGHETQQNASTIQTCIDLVHDLRKSRMALNPQGREIFIPDGLDLRGDASEDILVISRPPED